MIKDMDGMFATIIFGFTSGFFFFWFYIDFGAKPRSIGVRV